MNSKKNIVLTGSVAFDYLMAFPGYFSEHFLPDKLDSISLSFLVESLVKKRGGVAPNIAYTMALLSSHPTIMATVGEDFEEYRTWLNQSGVNTSLMKVISGESTASFFANTDRANAQIASFYPGAMSYASELSFHNLEGPVDLAMISPNDPEAMNKYVQECIELNIPYIFDPSQQIPRLTSSELIHGVKGSQALFVNDYEFGLIEKHTGLHETEIISQTQFTVVTRGEHGATVYVGDNKYQTPVVQPLKIVDPTGVGDSFRGGFITGYINGLDWKTCGQMGALAATYCLEVDSPQGQEYSTKEFITRYEKHFDDVESLKGIF